MKKELCDLIVTAGVPINSRGYWYIKEAVSLAMEDQENLLCVTKDLYPKIAMRYNTSPGSVEKAIRCAVRRSWETGYIPESIRALCDRRPTNTQYLTYLYELVLAKLEERRMNEK